VKLDREGERESRVAAVNQGNATGDGGEGRERGVKGLLGKISGAEWGLGDQRLG